MKKLLGRLFLILMETAMIGVAVFAHPLGLDPNAGWGMGRVLLLCAGILSALATIAFYYTTGRPAFSQKVGSRFVTPVLDFIHDSGAYRRMAGAAQLIKTRYVEARADRDAIFTPAVRRRWIYLFTGLVILLVLADYVFFVSVGRWVNWPATTDYYDQLATSFTHGKLSLPTKPDPALLAPNFSASDAESFSKTNYLLDASLYQGNYYLYWGATPALLLAVLKLALAFTAGDHILTFFFLSGVFLFSTLFILGIWRRFFTDLPGWALTAGVLLAGGAGPLPWMLCNPRIYEAAIASGQFFLVGEAYWGYAAFNRRSTAMGRLFLVGAFGALAVGSRLSLAPAAIWIALAVVWREATGYLRTGPRHRILFALAAVGLPLLLGFGAIAWYNWARFGSVFESGFRYALNGNDLANSENQFFTPLYVPTNLYNYFLNPLRGLPDFPFLGPNKAATFLAEGVPGFYLTTGRVTGLLWSDPFLLFALVALIALLMEKRESGRRAVDATTEDPGILRWTATLLVGTSVLAAAPLLLFFAAAMRYLADFVPTLTLLALLGFWQGFRLFGRNPISRASYVMIALALALVSLVVSNLLPFHDPSTRFAQVNPEFLKQIVQFFR